LLLEIDRLFRASQPGAADVGCRWQSRNHDIHLCFLWQANTAGQPNLAILYKGFECRHFHLPRLLHDPSFRLAQPGRRMAGAYSPCDTIPAQMNIVGLSAFFHESACCLLQDGRVVAAAEEERFTRVKHDPRLPVQAFRFCLQAGEIGIDGIDVLAYYENPVHKLSRQLWARRFQAAPPAAAPDDLAWLDPGQPERAIREGLGYEG